MACLERGKILIRWHSGWGPDRSSGKGSWRAGKELWRAVLGNLAFNPVDIGKMEGQDQILRELCDDRRAAVHLLPAVLVLEKCSFI